MAQVFFPASEIRIGWAGEKLDQLEFFANRAFDDARQALAEANVDTLQVLLNVNYVVTAEARRLISEYALHARAALDYIIFDLALHNQKREQDGTQFPIVKGVKHFPWKLDKSGSRQGTGPLEFLNPDEVTLVERFQPYNGFPLLLVLQRLSNRDKHRHFVHIGTEHFGSPVPTKNTNTPASTAQVEMQLQHAFKITLLDAHDALTSLRVLQTQLTVILRAFNELLDR
jgi:hypothetical protein